MKLSSAKIRKFLILSSLKKSFFYFVLKKFVLRNCHIFSKKSFCSFQEVELCIQNHSIFRTKGIFRTLEYLEPDAYSEHCQTFMMGLFAK